MLKARTFGQPSTACPDCGGELRFRALVQDPQSILRILTHLGLPTDVPNRRARGRAGRATRIGRGRERRTALPAPDGQVKPAAGWLIEHAGMARGTRAGHVGLSSRHALALVHHGGGSTAELIALSRLYVPYGFNFAAFVTPDAGVVSFKQLFGASWEVGLRVNLPRT